MNNKLTCPYCLNHAELVKGFDIYPRRPDLYNKNFYLCRPCDAYVGCHDKTTNPLGRLANPELRKWKKIAHSAFDPIWQKRFEQKNAKDKTYNKGMARGGRYKKLAELMGIERDQCHIGMFNVNQCKEVVRICKSGALDNDL